MAILLIFIISHLLFILMLYHTHDKVIIKILLKGDMICVYSCKNWFLHEYIRAKLSIVTKRYSFCNCILFCFTLWLDFLSYLNKLFLSVCSILNRYKKNYAMTNERRCIKSQYEFNMSVILVLIITWKKLNKKQLYSY